MYIQKKIITAAKQILDARKGRSIGGGGRNAADEEEKNVEIYDPRNKVTGKVLYSRDPIKDHRKSLVDTRHYEFCLAFNPIGERQWVISTNIDKATLRSAAFKRYAAKQEWESVEAAEAHLMANPRIQAGIQFRYKFNGEDESNIYEMTLCYQCNQGIDADVIASGCIQSSNNSGLIAPFQVCSPISPFPVNQCESATRCT